MINEIILTEDQAKPFRAQMKKPVVCTDVRHFRPIPLHTQPIKAYPHDGGWKVPGLEGLWWLYIACPRCGYEWAIWKLGVGRAYDPTAERNIYTNNPYGNQPSPDTFNAQYEKEFSGSGAQG